MWCVTDATLRYIFRASVSDPQESTLPVHGES